jgi:hypothetical protein
MKKKIEYCLEMIMRERGSFPDVWVNRYKSEKARQKAIDEIENEDRTGPAPDCYINCGRMWIEIDGKEWK